MTPHLVDIYRPHADLNRTQPWNSPENICVIPGCETATVDLPGGFEQTETTINYTYDPLYRLTEAKYPNSDYYHYAYDSVGNRLTQETMVGGLSSTVSYNYDIANRLIAVSNQSSVNSYQYNGLVDRLTQTVDEQTTNYTLDLNAGLTQVLNDGTSEYICV